MHTYLFLRYSLFSHWISKKGQLWYNTCGCLSCFDLWLYDKHKRLRECYSSCTSVGRYRDVQMFPSDLFISKRFSKKNPMVMEVWWYTQTWSVESMQLYIYTWAALLYPFVKGTDSGRECCVWAAFWKALWPRNTVARVVGLWGMAVISERLYSCQCLPMAQEAGVQYQIMLYQRLKKWHLMSPCLTLSIIRYGSRVKWSNPGKGVAPSPTPQCSS